MSDVLSILRLALAGRYRLEHEIGVGGMATVYLAQDERHDRRVAIKVLRPELAAAVGAERFLREIKVTAALQHPHILQLYDSGEADGLVYYVMPYVEGESLRTRLNRLKQLPLRDALEIARAVASALDYAHKRGLIHRDIKPENILLTGDPRDGATGLQALVADFGISVAIESVGAGRLTGTGMSVGTPAYMSPEQASAEQNLGVQSDVYALGVVLYEMLTGEPPFTGPTAQSVVARLMVETPAPLRLRRTTVSPRLEAVVMKALEKTPADRFSSAAEFGDALQADDNTPVTSAVPEHARPSRNASLLPWALTAVLAAVVAVLLLRRGSPATAGDGVTQLAIAMPPGMTAASWTLGVAIGAHGRIVAFIGTGADGHNQLYVKRLEEPNATLLAGTRDANHPVFSPDGTWLAFVAAGQLKKVSLASGSVTLLADSVGESSSGQWTPDGFILFGASRRGAGPEIRRVSENGGAQVVVTSPGISGVGTMLLAPQLLPGGRILLYTVRSGSAKGPVFRVMVRPDTGTPARLLIEGASAARYLGDGRLVYQKGEELYVATLDLSTLIVSNDRRVLSGVAAMNAGFNGCAWDLSDDVLVYGSSIGPTRSLTWVDRDGRTQALPAQPRSYLGLALSPDGGRAVMAVQDGARSDVWVYDLTQDVLTRSTTDGGTFAAIWARDGQHLTTLTQTKGAVSVYLLRSDGAGTPELLVTSATFLWPSAWTKDSILIVMDNGDLSTLDMRHGRTLHPLVHTPARELGGRLSPDERWLAYFSDVTGAFELYVTAFPAGGPSWRVSRGGAEEAVWSHDGRELFFRSENGRQMLSVPVAAGATFSAGPPRLLFEGDYFSFGGPGLVSYDVSHDGKRFLMLQRAGTGSDHLNVIQGWSRMIQAPSR